MTTHKARLGMTLVEIVVTMALAAILTLAVFATLTGNDQARKVNRQQELARETCRAWLDHISDLANQGADPSTLNNTYYAVPLPAGATTGPVFPAAMTDPSVRLVGPPAAPNLSLPLRVQVATIAPPQGGSAPLPRWQVTITVTWIGADQGAGTQVFSMSTVVVNRRGGA